MCGIAGFYGAFPEGLIQKMGNSIAHRGPDDVGIYEDRSIGIALVHRRLSIIDVSPAGHQPMTAGDEKVSVIFNGEIYNYRELRVRLEDAGFKFRGHSDTEVLLNLYLQKGEGMLSELNGIFAFAIWDGRSGTMLVARDGLGVKPLYYAETACGFIFASELKALLCSKAVGNDLDVAALRDYATFLWCPAPATMLKGVRKLEPGTTISVRNGKIEREKAFYRLPFDLPIHSRSADEAALSVRDELESAVRLQLVSDVPLGAFLSGGLDSSAIVVFAKRHSQRRLSCFTIDYDAEDGRREGFAADLPYAQRVAKYLDVDLHTIRVGPEMASQLESMIFHLDEPLADPAALNVLFISKFAREHGIKVLLSGAGGDDIFSGYRRHRALDLERFWAWLPAGHRRLLRRAAGRLPSRPSTLRRVAKALAYADQNGDERLASYFYWLRPQTVEGLLSADLREIPWTDRLVASLRDMPQSGAPLNRMLYLECRHFLADHNLNYTDKMSMAAGVEVRVPFLDPQLVETAARLPVAYKQHGSCSKWILKKAMTGLLPEDVIHRPKTGFGVPLRAWLRGPLRPLMSDLISKETVQKRGWFDARAVAELAANEADGHVDGAYSLFAVACIEIWARRFLDRRGTAI